ncbi:unnamed protein product [Orchesella dallaii]|uniref:Uncharacterized protein n=1 Tax=Orchesella dallaii TaxID=48710 RepID=A0ABP1R9S2_9HEXA
MNTSSKAILLIVFFMCLSLPANAGNTPTVDACMSLTVGDVCTILNTLKTCESLTNGAGTSLRCCYTGVNAQDATKPPECKCCPPSELDCKKCIELTRSFNMSLSQANI